MKKVTKRNKKRTSKSKEPSVKKIFVELASNLPGWWMRGETVVYWQGLWMQLSNKPLETGRNWPDDRLAWRQIEESQVRQDVAEFLLAVTEDSDTEHPWFEDLLKLPVVDHVAVVLRRLLSAGLGPASREVLLAPALAVSGPEHRTLHPEEHAARGVDVLTSAREAF